MKNKITILFSLIVSAITGCAASPPPLRYNPITTNQPTAMTNVIQQVAGPITNNLASTNYVEAMKGNSNWWFGAQSFSNTVYMRGTVIATQIFTSVIGQNTSKNFPVDLLAAGGLGNTVDGDGATVFGGRGNYAYSDMGGTIVGGRSNFISVDFGAIIGARYSTNASGGDYSVIVGGQTNRIIGIGLPSAENSVIIGGSGNIIDGDNGGESSSMIMGRDNYIGANNAIILGQQVTNTTANSVAIGYSTNALRVTSDGKVTGRSFYGDGSNWWSGVNAFSNTVYMRGSVIATQIYTSVIGQNRSVNNLPDLLAAGGLGNTVAGDGATIFGGRGNYAYSDMGGSIFGGRSNNISIDFGAIIGAGFSSNASGGDYSVIVGGRSNYIVGYAFPSAENSVIIGGSGNVIDGDNGGESSSMIIGSDNYIGANNAIAIGQKVTNTVANSVAIGYSTNFIRVKSDGTITIPNSFSGWVTNVGFGHTNWTMYTNGIVWTNLHNL